MNMVDLAPERTVVELNNMTLVCAYPKRKLLLMLILLVCIYPVTSIGSFLEFVLICTELKNAILQGTTFMFNLFLLTQYV